jgi:regulatory protein
MYAARDGRSDRAGRGDGGRGGPRAERAALDPETAAREICLRQLAVRARSRAELARALARKEIPEDVVERVLSRFGEVGLIDDGAFAAEFVATRHGAQGLARQALSVQLWRRGIDPETAEAALAAVDGEAEESAARALVSRRLRATAGLDAPVRARKLVGMLARKGYPPELAYRVVRDELCAAGAQLEGDPPVDM